MVAAAVGRLTPRSDPPPAHRRNSRARRRSSRTPPCVRRPGRSARLGGIPRNMALALTGRVGAVAALLQFAPEDGPAPDSVSDELRAELADCLVYLVGLSDALGIDVLEHAV